MKNTCFLLLIIFPLLARAQNDEQQVRNYLSTHFPAMQKPEKVWLFQCKYKPGKTWQYMVACINTFNNRPLTTLLFAERINDSLLAIAPFHFSSVEAFDHINMDRSRDEVEELYITTSKDSGNLDEKFTGIYSCKTGRIDTLITFHSFGYKTTQLPYFKLMPDMVVEQEDLCQLTDLNGDGKMDIANRVHRKIYSKEPGTDTFAFTHETDYAEYKMEKGRFVKMKPKAGKDL